MFQLYDTIYELYKDGIVKPVDLVNLTFKSELVQYIKSQLISRIHFQRASRLRPVRYAVIGKWIN